MGLAIPISGNTVPELSGTVGSSMKQSSGAAQTRKKLEAEITMHVRLVYELGNESDHITVLVEYC